MRLSGGIGVAAALAWSWPAVADACDPCVSHGVALLEPTESYPGNGLFAVHLSEFPEGVDIAVAGAPAAVESVDMSWTSAGWEVWRLVEPAPADAVVQLTSSEPWVTCFGEDPIGGLSFVATAPDVAAPLPPEQVSFDLHTYSVVDVGCGDGEHTIWLHGDVPEDPDEPLRVIRVEILHGTEVIVVRHFRVTDEELHLPIRLDVFELDGRDPRDLDLRVYIMDAAGNTSEATELHEPCHARHEPPDAEPYDYAAPEPEWTQDDLVEGGTCPPPEPDPGTSETGMTPQPPSTSTTTVDPPDDDATDATSQGHPDADPQFANRGCGCSTDPERSRSAWLLLLLLGWVVNRRGRQSAAVGVRAMSSGAACHCWHTV